MLDKRDQLGQKRCVFLAELKPKMLLANLFALVMKGMLSLVVYIHFHELKLSTYYGSFSH